MSFTAASLWAVTASQYRYKLKGYSNLIAGLILTQLFGLLFSMTGTGTWGSSYGAIGVWARVYSGDVIIFFSLSWMFCVAVFLPTRYFQRQDYTFVSNRASSNLSNIALLVTASIFAGLTASLLEMALKIITYFKTGDTLILGEGFFLKSGEMLLGFYIAVMYLIVVSALGYFIGMLTQVHMLFAVVVPAAFLGMLIKAPHVIKSVLGFLTAETSVPVFSLKALGMAVLLFGSSILVSNRLEVKR